jgi:hypothetical protein
VLLAEAKSLAGKASALYRVRAYRQAAAWIAMYPRELETVYAAEGRAGLANIPGVGAHLSYTLEGLLTTGEVRTVRSEDAHREPERLTSSLPGIGPLIAAKLRDEANIETVEQLAEALDRAEGNLPGLGPRRVAILREALRERAEVSAPPADEPDLADLLAADALFREERCDQEPLFVRPLTWSRAGYQFRVDLDRSALAYRLNRVGDRVVVHFTDGKTTGERLIETETSGDLTGKRVVRGREAETRRWYARRRLPCGLREMEPAEG